MKRRAELEEETRRRITESAVELHTSVGPARTSISSVAERAGVRRSTVYRHFPDERALFAACSSHWQAANPPPDPGPWAEIEDPDERARAALTHLYAYYRRSEGMFGNVLRDVALVPMLDDTLDGYRAYLGAVRDILITGRGARGRARNRAAAAIGHALSFATWRSLAREQNLSDEQAADLMRRMIAAAA